METQIFNYSCGPPEEGTLSFRLEVWMDGWMDGGLDGWMSLVNNWHKKVNLAQKAKSDFNEIWYVGWVG